MTVANISNKDELDFLTFDRSFVRGFEGFGSGDLILASAHPSKIVILRDLESEEIASLIKQYELLSFEAEEERLLDEPADDGHTLMPFRTQGVRGAFVTLEWLFECFKRKFDKTISSVDEFNKVVASLTLSEQREVWSAMKPLTLGDKRGAYTKRFVNRCVHLNLPKILSEYDFWDAIDMLVKQLTYPSYRQKVDGRRVVDDYPGRELIYDNSNKARILSLLCFLRSRELIVLSFGFYTRLKDENKDAHDRGTKLGNLVHAVLNDPGYLSPQLVQLITLREEKLFASEKGTSHAQELVMHRAWFLMSTTVRKAEDLSAGLFDWAAVGSKRLRWVEDLINFIETRLRSSAQRFPRPRLVNKNNKPDGKDKNFDWMLHAAPRLRVWVDLLNKYLNQIPTTYLSSRAAPLSYFADYLVSLGDDAPETPEFFERRVYVRRVINTSKRHPTFREFLDTRTCTHGGRIGELISTNTRSRAMNNLRLLMGYHVECNRALQEKADVALKLMLVNPVDEDDCKWQDSGRSGKTHRRVVPEAAIDAIKDILLSPDEEGTPTFSWLKNHPSLGSDWVAIPNLHGDWMHAKMERGRVVYWQPSRGMALYLLVSIPLRLFQVRWLDSGVADEYIWDYKTATSERNLRPPATVGVRNGVFQPDETLTLDGAARIGIHVTTNKNQAWRASSRIAPFNIPWPLDDVYEMLEMQRNWAFHVAGNVYSKAVKADFKTISPEIESLLPEFHPLFRDHSTNGALYPVSRAKVEHLWILVCEEAEKRLEASGVNIQLVRRREIPSVPEDELTAVYDMHSLRVTGTTWLLGKGVPIHIISEYVLNHGAITTTYVYDRTEISSARAALTARLTLDATQVESIEALQSVLMSLDDGSPLSATQVRAIVGDEKYRSFFLHRGEGEVESEALSRASDGSSWRTMVDGICPGGDCDTGGPDGTPVEAGPGRCGNCRYYLTGTAFVFQQAHRCNMLMYELQQLVHEESQLKSARRQMDAKGQAYARATERLEQLSIRSRSVYLDWWGRYILFQATVGEIRKGEKQAVLLTQADAESLKLRAQATSKAHLLAEICRSVEILQIDTERLGPQLEYRDLVCVLLTKGGASLPQARLGVNQLTLVNAVGDALFSLFSAEFSCGAEQVYSKMEELAASDEVLSARLAQSIRNVAHAIDSSSQAKRVRLELR